MAFAAAAFLRHLIQSHREVRGTIEFLGMRGFARALLRALAVSIFMLHS
ncbi:hypothetical protein SPIROBIBN47_290038 [uncultured spirochete]|uniref:Uncharacterized protein n=1 Tax=uncultured spirochete TaxID=156406 RepID=A0A3P3XJ10_9SPIR|nr:hypothetical protein SPIROBIBN47_290038 [uncultured spirochete]